MSGSSSMASLKYASATFKPSAVRLFQKKRPLRYDSYTTGFTTLTFLSAACSCGFTLIRI